MLGAKFRKPSLQRSVPLSLCTLQAEPRNPPAWQPLRPASVCHDTNLVSDVTDLPSPLPALSGLTFTCSFSYAVPELIFVFLNS